jgi:hypothetical protein
VLHERSVIQSLVSTLHHTLRSRASPDLARDCLGLLIHISRTEFGCDAMVSSTKSLGPGVNVMTNIFGDFQQFFFQNCAFFWKPMLWPPMKNVIFAIK